MYLRSRHIGPAVVRINLFVRSIATISDIKMVSVGLHYSDASINLGNHISSINSQFINTCKKIKINSFIGHDTILFPSPINYSIFTHNSNKISSNNLTLFDYLAKNYFYSCCLYSISKQNNSWSEWNWVISFLNLDENKFVLLPCIRYDKLPNLQQTFIQLASHIIQIEASNI